MTSPNIIMFEHCIIDDISQKFKVIDDIGSGSYGIVQKCFDTESKRIVAIKKIKILADNDGFPQSSLREVSILSKLNHDNIVKLYQVLFCKKDRGIYLVFEYCEFDLNGLIYGNVSVALDSRFFHTIMKQILLSLHFLRVKRIIHRDLKPANVFINKKNILKIGDFGLARDLIPNEKYTSNVVTQWYRPPELLLGCEKYGTEVDMWSAGCIFYEILTKKHLFSTRDKNDSSQLQTIFKICGTPNDENWPNWRDCGNNTMILNYRYTSTLVPHLQSTIPEAEHGIIDLLVSMLELNPANRITPENAVNHSYFRSSNVSLDPNALPILSMPDMHSNRINKSHNQNDNQNLNNNNNTRPKRIEPCN